MPTSHKFTTKAEQKLVSLINGNETDTTTLKKEAIAAIDKYIQFEESQLNGGLVLAKTVRRLLSTTRGEEDDSLIYNSNEASSFKFFIEDLRTYFMNPKFSHSFTEGKEWKVNQLADALNRLHEFFESLEQEENTAYIDRVEVEENEYSAKRLLIYLRHYTVSLELAQARRAIIDKYPCPI